MIKNSKNLRTAIFFHNLSKHFTKDTTRLTPCPSVGIFQKEPCPGNCFYLYFYLQIPTILQVPAQAWLKQASWIIRPSLSVSLSLAYPRFSFHLS